MVEIFAMDADDKAGIEANIGWLATASPDEWHRVALDFNWGEPLYVLNWIVHQPNCDIATALTIFWLGEPEFWLEESGSNKDTPNAYSYMNRAICAYIADRVLAGGYTRSEIMFQPDTWTKNCYLNLTESVKKFANPNFRTSPDLILNRRGRKVENDAEFYRRYPEHFHHSCLLDYEFKETPEYYVQSSKYEEILKKTHNALPNWLKQNDEQSPRIVSEPAAEMVESALESLISDIIQATMVLSALVIVTTSYQIGPKAIIFGFCALVYFVYSALSKFKTVSALLNAPGWTMSPTWLANLVTLTVGISGMFSIVIFKVIVLLKSNYGYMTVFALALIIVGVITWIIPSYLSKVSVKSPSIRDNRYMGR